MSALTAMMLSLVAGVPAQEADLKVVAEAARHAFLTHRFDSLLGDTESVRIRLPNQRAGAPTRGPMAAAALEAFTRHHKEVRVSVRGAAVVSHSQGYVELDREFRPMGVGQGESQRVLISLRFSAGRWQVVEVWVIQGP